MPKYLSNLENELNIDKVLIVGDAGFLGSSLALNINSNFFKLSSVNRSMLDLSGYFESSFDNFLSSEKFKFAIICAAMTDVEACYKNQWLSTQVNVVGTKKMLELFSKNKVTPIFFSSDYVFSGKDSPYVEDEMRIPKTVYGAQKLEVELYLENNFSNFLIFRTSKLMSKTLHHRSILYPILKNFSLGIKSKCFDDQLLNPVFVEDIANILCYSMLNKLSGVFHLGTKKIFTRAELGLFLARSMGVDSSLIQPIKMSEITFSESRPFNNSLNCQKIEKVTGYTFCEVDEALGELQSLFKML